MIEPVGQLNIVADMAANMRMLIALMQTHFAPVSTMAAGGGQQGECEGQNGMVDNGAYAQPFDAATDAATAT